MIQHLVLSGAGIYILIQIGLLDYSIQQEIIQLKNIKSIYSTSAGSIISILLLLSIPIHEIRDYVIQRPWGKFFDVNFLTLSDTKGIISSDHLYNMIKPFMLAYDIPDTFTLLDLYNKTNVDLHIFTTKLNDMITVDLNHTTHPDITLYEAISMTASLPIMFTPVCYKNEYYIDGGVLNHCPIPPTIYDNHDSFFIINIIANIQEYTHDTSIIDYITIMFLKTLNILCFKEHHVHINNCKHYYPIKTEISMFDIQSWNETFNNIEYRKKLYDIGYNYSKKVLLE
jgi:NTE family protein